MFSKILKTRILTCINTSQSHILNEFSEIRTFFSKCHLMHTLKLALPLNSLPLVYDKHYQIWFLVGIHVLPYSASMERNTSGQVETGASSSSLFTHFSPVIKMNTYHWCWHWLKPASCLVWVMSSSSHVFTLVGPKLGNTSAAKFILVHKKHWLVSASAVWPMNSPDTTNWFSHTEHICLLSLWDDCDLKSPTSLCDLV